MACAPTTHSILGWWTETSKSRQPSGLRMCRIYNAQKNGQTSFIEAEVRTSTRAYCGCARAAWQMMVAVSRAVVRWLIAPGEAASQACALQYGPGPAQRIAVTTRGNASPQVSHEGSASIHRALVGTLKLN